MNKYINASAEKKCIYNAKFDTRCKNISYILISLCTYKRKKELVTALKSIKELCLPKDIKIGILVIDNDEKMTARDVVEEFRSKLEIEIFYRVEEKRGLASVRNKLLKSAIELGASHIALIDDDEIVDVDWLIEHVKFFKENEECCVSAGPAYYKFDKLFPGYIEKNRLFKQPKFEVKEVHKCATGNVFFPVSIAKQSGIYFDEKFIFTGGEDADFFSRASIAGYRIFLNPNAKIYQIIDDERASIKSMLKRAYHNGFSEMLLMDRVKKQTFGFRFKSLLNLILRGIWLIPSLLCGRTYFLNTLVHFIQAFARAKAMFTRKSYEFYR